MSKRKAESAEQEQGVCGCYNSTCKECMAGPKQEQRKPKAQKHDKKQDIPCSLSRFKELQARYAELETKYQETKEQLKRAEKDLQEEQEEHEEAEEAWEEKQKECEEVEDERNTALKALEEKVDLEYFCQGCCVRDKTIKSNETELCASCWEDVTGIDISYHLQHQCKNKKQPLKCEDVLQCNNCGEIMCINCYHSALGMPTNLSFTFPENEHSLPHNLSVYFKNVQCFGCAQGHVPFRFLGPKIFDVPHISELKRHGCDTGKEELKCTCAHAAKPPKLSLQERLRHRLFCHDLFKLTCPFPDCAMSIPVPLQQIASFKVEPHDKRNQHGLDWVWYNGLQLGLYNHILQQCRHAVACTGCNADEVKAGRCPSVLQLRNLPSHLLEAQNTFDMQHNMHKIGMFMLQNMQPNPQQNIGDLMLSNAQQPAFQTTVADVVHSVATDHDRPLHLRNQRIRVGRHSQVGISPDTHNPVIQQIYNQFASAFEQSMASSAAQQEPGSSSSSNSMQS